MQCHSAVEDINAITITRRSGAGAVSALIVAGAAVSTAIVLCNIQPLAPLFFAGVSIEREADFPINSVYFLHDDCKRTPLGNSKRSEPKTGGGLPNRLYPVTWPVGDV